MLERVELRYVFDDKDGSRRIVNDEKESETLKDYEVCEMFMEFMRAIGFSEANVLKYFRD